MSDDKKIFELYVENAVAKEQPTMTQYASGTKRWRLHSGELHRENAPVIEYADGHKEWWLHDKLHRMDGPAIEFADGTKAWFLHGEYYVTPEAWAEALLKQRNEPHDAVAIDAFLKTILKKDVEQAL